MNASDLKDELSDEVETILAADFDISVTRTATVPHNSDGAITFPNLSEKSQRCKLIDSCVLYIDIRRSTELNLQNDPTTVAKLYSAFVRAMTRCARANGGHVRGIIGDRLMVIFESDNCFVSAVETAISMNSTAQFVINKHFLGNEITCGIGIDSGPMLATKTGFSRRGVEQQAYRSLVWLGRPANVASKLTDIANKPAQSFTYQNLEVCRTIPDSAIGRALLGTTPWIWRPEAWTSFLKGFAKDLFSNTWRHQDPAVTGFRMTDETFVARGATPPILMTAAVYDGFRTAVPHHEIFGNNWLYPIEVNVPGYSGQVYAGDIFWVAFRGY
jgi:adenylate cyclase